jgi:serine/threonine protein kinase
MPRTACLTPDELKALQLGDLPESALEELIGHLEGCPRCEAAAQGLDDLADPVSVAFRRSAQAGPPEPPAPARVGDYEILGEIGRGGMGIVYKARHLQLRRTVALKMLLGGSFTHHEERARFRAEAEAVARLQHPHIVQIYEVGEHEVQPGVSRPYFTLEFAGGGSLAGRLAGRPQPPRQAAVWMEALARAAHYAHRQGIVHRDLKPSNVLLTADGQPKLCDFGVAKLSGGSGVKTVSGTLLGTAEYMAPEQATAGAAVGPPADVYALGAVLYELLTGRPPFRGAAALDTVLMVLSQEPVPPTRLQPRVPRDLETICLKCLQKDPGKRYESAEALADDLRRFLAGDPIRARPLGRAERLWRWCRRNPVPTSLLLAVTLGSAGGMWHLSRLSESLVRFSALEGAAQQSEMFDEVNDFYSAHVVDRLKQSGIEAAPDYARRPRAIPLPATFTIELGEQISGHSQRGMEVRLYSDAPFRFRKDGGPRDDFEQEAIRRLKGDPDRAFFRFEEYRGRSSLRYATARRMRDTCVNCHNAHPDSPRTDWEVGDVRGVLEIIRPLDKDAARTQEGLRGTFILVVGLSGGLLLLSSLMLVVGNRRRRPPARAPDGSG